METLPTRDERNRDAATCGAPWAGISAASLLLTMVLAACTLSTPNFRVTPHAPDFNYIPKDRITSAMWVLAAEVRAIDEWVRIAGGQPNPGIDTRIRLALDRMLGAARRLDTPGQSTQHPDLNQNLGVFMQRLARARRAMDADPPNRSQAAALASGCYLCHGTQTASVQTGTDSAIGSP